MRLFALATEEWQDKGITLYMWETDRDAALRRAKADDPMWRKEPTIIINELFEVHPGARCQPKAGIIRTRR